MTRESIMTKETRSSAKMAILPIWVIDRIKEEMRLGPAAWQAITDAVEQAEMPQVLPCEVKLPPGTVISQGTAVSTLMLAIQQRASQPAHAQVFSNAEPERPHAEPIAWMVGTAFWWPKEEAERDAAETGLPIVGLGPMSGVAPPEQNQGEPYGWAHDDGKEFTTHADHASDLQREGIQMLPLYTHADPGEVEQLLRIIRDLNEERDELGAEAGRLRAKLATVKADRDAHAQNAIDLREELAREKKAHMRVYDVHQHLSEVYHSLRAQLAEAQALLRDMRQNKNAQIKEFSVRINAALSASVKPDSKS